MATGYRRIPSVAHNLGHSFLSVMNSRGEGRGWTLVPRVIFARVAEMRVGRIHLDLLRQRIEPDALDVDAVRESIGSYARTLPALLRSQGVAPEAVTAATITLTLDHARTRPSTWDPAERIPGFTCVVELTDDRGRVHRGTPAVWD